MNRSTALLLLGSILSVSLSGCLVVANSSTTHGASGQFVGKETLSQIQAGKTTREWVLAVLGEPAEVTEAGDGTEILRYRYVQTKHENFAVFVILAANNKQETTQDLFIEVKDGVVQKYWQKLESTG